MLFKLADLEEDLDKPLNEPVLGNPNHKITKHLLYIYSMESFIFTELNRVCREKDTSKINYYGAFAASLSLIINEANDNRVEDKIENTITLYRGLKLTTAEIELF